MYNQRTTTYTTINILLVHKQLCNTGSILLIYVTSKIYNGDALVHPCTFLMSVNREDTIYESIIPFIFQKPKLSARTLVFLRAATCYQWWLQTRVTPIKILNILYSIAQLRIGIYSILVHQQFDHRQGIESFGVSLKKLQV